MSNKYFRDSLIPSAATETTLYTVPAASSAVLRSLRVTNVGAGVSSIVVTQYDSGDATAHYLLNGKSVSVSETIDMFSGIPCVLEGGDVLKVTSSVAGVHFYLSYLEVDRS
tara:strand:- start:9186 stop:9518 length:333 start_codon:yes stop_codon:yes gene_type:complete